MENESSIISREKFDQVASWLSATVCTAFFSSLERFSCVNLSTTDPDDDDEDEAKDRPLTLTNYNNNEPSNDVANLPVWSLPLSLSLSVCGILTLDPRLYCN